MTDSRASRYKQYIRILMLLDATEYAALTPIKLMHLHAFAFLADILSPVWGKNPEIKKLLKRRGGPFFPELQEDLDNLTGMGLISIENLKIEKNEQEEFCLEGCYCLLPRAEKILEDAYYFNSYLEQKTMFRELALMLASIPAEKLEAAICEDATYADKGTSFNEIIDFAEWKNTNYSANVANYFEKLTPNNMKISAAQKINLYVHYLEREANAL